MDQRPGRYRPGLERLEARDLPSGSHAAASASTSAGRGASSTISQLVGSLYAPVTTTAPMQVGNQVFPAGSYAVPQPTAAEVRRETLTVKFVGTYYVGAPRFSDQSETIHIYSDGKIVSSDWFLHGRAQLIIFPPADPAATPTTQDPVAGQTVGLVTLFPSNALQSSDVMFLDLTNPPGVASNNPSILGHGLPSQLQFTLDPTGAGAFTSPAYTTTPANPLAPAPGGPGEGAVSFSDGTGVVQLKYMPAHPRGGARQTGTVIVTIQGLANLSGALNALYKGIN